MKKILLKLESILNKKVNHSMANIYNRQMSIKHNEKSYTLNAEKDRELLC